MNTTATTATLAWSPHVTVATVIEHNGLFLMVEEADKEHQGKTPKMVYNQPAGHVEAQETLVEAAIRETLEETGYEVEISHFIGVYTYTPATAPHKTYYRFCFAGKVQQQNKTVIDADINRVLWMNYAELKHSTQLRSPLVKKCIEDYLAGQQQPLSFIYEHNNANA